MKATQRAVDWVLRKARELISRENQWTRGASARSSNNKAVRAADPNAVSWCAQGAVLRAAEDLSQKGELPAASAKSAADGAIDRLNRAAQASPDKKAHILDVNDDWDRTKTRVHGATVRVFDRAIDNEDGEVGTSDWKKFHDKYAGAFQTHNAVEMLRERRSQAETGEDRLIRRHVQVAADITLRWMEPFSLELWLKAVAQEQQGPNTARDKKTDAHLHVHDLEKLWNDIAEPLKTKIEEAHERLRNRVDTAAEQRRMRRRFMAIEWIDGDMDQIKAPDMTKVCEHYNSAFPEQRYGQHLDPPAFAKEKRTALEERGYEIGLRCARSAMREVLLNNEGVKGETRRLITDPELLPY